MRMKLALGLALSACANAPQTDVCAAASEHVSACLGQRIPAGACDPAEAERVLGLTCEDIGSDETKDDGLLADLLCSAGATSHCDQEPLFPRESGEPTRYPIVLEHGFNSSSASNGLSLIVASALRDAGYSAYVSDVPAYNSLEVRAPYLAETIDRALIESGASKVHVIGHSMGGLDARQLLCFGASGSSRDYGDVIASLTTIATPHRGTKVADAVLATNAPSELLDAWGLLAGVGDQGELPLDVASAFVDLSEQTAATFNETCPNDPRVRYYSYASIASVPGSRSALALEEEACLGRILRHPGTRALLPPNMVVSGFYLTVRGEGRTPNDGLVAASSAVWGEFLGCLPADHVLVSGDPHRPDFVTRTGWSAEDFYVHHARFLQSHAE
jgi:triacylglycerol lipase